MIPFRDTAPIEPFVDFIIKNYSEETNESSPWKISDKGNTLRIPKHLVILTSDLETIITAKLHGDPPPS